MSHELGLKQGAERQKAWAVNLQNLMEEMKL